MKDGRNNSQRNDSDKRTILIILVIRDERKTSKPFEKSISASGFPFDPPDQVNSLNHRCVIWTFGFDLGHIFLNNFE
jgi:hypothetical protein